MAPRQVCTARLFVALSLASCLLRCEALLARQVKLANQVVGQAAEPMDVHVDYDVPKHGTAPVVKIAKMVESSASVMFASVSPQAPAADQPVWQAAEPVTVNVDYDAPTHSAADVMKAGKKIESSASFMASSVLPQAPLADLPVWQAAEPVTVNIDYDVPTHSAW
eukprot:TRINITY_DN1982_c0_g1_i1.p1 TRINITY_DN1982_c0_g1~~TRINITY_DN1982_c0_g1_i1.p1  ORF type:complete len:165 (-),score=36.75 TRINITY_DN1982_c0_g1_i1:410-904(-)